VSRSASAPASPARLRRRIVVAGLVQGVGFRPFVYLTATELGLSGSVVNDSAGVVIDAEGSEADLVEFERRLLVDAPPLANVEGIAVSELRTGADAGFTIRDSSHSGSGRTLASPDVATCPACLAEFGDPRDRRYRHPFITCTNCGPRFTIILDLPYDRPTTTMAGFEMCDACAVEYHDPTNRRFHAQTIACPDCGPRLSLLRRDEGSLSGESAVVEARRMLAAGAVLAVKGIGGYHLMCDATNPEAVAGLRHRKNRGNKPFAVMARDLDSARRYVEFDEREADLLISPVRPIVLLAPSPDGSRIASAVSPGVPDLGIMLAYTPIQMLLFGLDGDDPGPDLLVATSGNVSGEPIVADDAEALTRLTPLVDGWLVHDRPIHVPCDDSVVRVVDGEQLPLRRARGYAPMPISLPVEVVPTLATGADLKNTCCLASGRQAWVSQHIGDMDDISTLGAFEKTEQLMESLTGVAPKALVVDAHPGYGSTRWARTHAGDRVVRSVQHHHAHLASLMAEHGIEPGTLAIGIVFDGTGYGTDGAIWGGEVLVGDYEGFERFAHLAYVPLPGGDVAVERPYRMALAHLDAAGVKWEADLASVRACPAPEAGVLARQLETGFGSVPTSSMGRLFDAIASLCDVCQVVDYEAQAAIELEGLARFAPEDLWNQRPYAFGRGPFDTVSGARTFDAAPVVRAVVEDLRAGVTPTEIAIRFHGAVVGQVVSAAEEARAALGLSLVGLTGGVFQNPILLARSVRELRGRGFVVLRHRFLPPNDGGVALGQMLVGATRSTLKGAPLCA
jgi:hydrogenase maturation protein HypF